MNVSRKSAGRFMAFVLALAITFTMLPINAVVQALGEGETYYIFVVDGQGNAVEGAAVKITAVIENEDENAEKQYLTDGEDKLDGKSLGVTNADGRVECASIYAYFHPAEEPAEPLAKLDIALEYSLDGYKQNAEDVNFTISDTTSVTKVLYKIVPVKNVTAYSNTYDGEQHDAVTIEYKEDDTHEGDTVSYIYKLKDGEEITADTLDKISTVADAEKFDYIQAVVKREFYADYVSEKVKPEIIPSTYDDGTYKADFIDREYTLEDTDSVNAVAAVTDSMGVEVDSSLVKYVIVENGEEVTYDNSPAFSVSQFSNDSVDELTKDIKVVITTDDNHFPYEISGVAKLKIGTLPDFTFNCYGEKGEDGIYTATFDGNSHSLVNSVDVSDESSIDNYTVEYQLNGENAESLDVTNCGVYDISAVVSKAGFTSKSYAEKVVVNPAAVDDVQISAGEIDYAEDSETLVPISQPLFNDSMISYPAQKNYKLEFSPILSADEQTAITENNTQSSLAYSEDIPYAANAGTYYYFVKVTALNGETADTNYKPFYVAASQKIKSAAMDYSDKITDKELKYNDAEQPVCDLSEVLRENVTDADGNVLCEDSYSFKLVSKNMMSADETYENTVPTVKDAGLYVYVFTLNRTNYDTFSVSIVIKVTSAQLEVTDNETTSNVVMNTKNHVSAKITDMLDLITIDNGNVVYFDKANEIDRLNELGDVTYEIVKSDNSAVISSNGYITYYGKDNITIRATFAATSNISTKSVEYTVNVDYSSENIKPILSGTKGKLDNSVQWYRSNVLIKPSNSDWKLRECNADNSDVITSTKLWTGTITKSSETTYDLTVVFTNTDGEISKPQTVSKFAVDKTKPTLSATKAFVVSATNGLAQTSFGCFSLDTITVNINAAKDLSGIDKIVLQSKETGETTYKDINHNVNADSEFYLNIPSGKTAFSGTIRAYVVDKAGNTNTIAATTANSNIKNSSQFIMIEQNVPSVKKFSSYADKGVASFETAAGRTVFAGDPTFNFTAEDVKNGTQNNSGFQYITAKINDSQVFNEDYTSKKTTAKNITLTCAGVNANSDGSYKCVVTVTDNAGNTVTSSEYTVFKDTTAPIITEFSFDGNGYADADGRDVMNVEATSYGFYFKDSVNVTVSAADIAGTNEYSAGVKSITFKAVDINGKTVVEGTNSTDSTTSFSVPKDFKGQIYAYATDNLGNTPYDSTSGSGFVHPDGSVVESSEKHFETSSISISAPTASGKESSSISYNYSGSAMQDKTMDYNTTQNVPLYNANPVFGVTVSDTFSGIRSVKWSFIDGGTVSSTSTVQVDNGGNLVNNNGWDILGTDNNLVTSIGTNITINGNSNDSILLVELVDNAGNASYDYYCFGIDKTKPTISVTYDNNTADPQNKQYYNKIRKATIVVTERNFDEANIVAAITNADGTVPKISQWKYTAGSTPDSGKYTATIDYTTDGAYTFAMSFKDNAGNKADDIAKQEFTVDTTLPVVTVEYDNNTAENEKYFNKQRVATVTVTEHNFDSARAQLSITAALNKKAVNAPKAEWKTDGDKHTATITYKADADYTFDVKVTDMASNADSGADYKKSKAGKSFVVDTTINAPKIMGVEDKHSYKDEAAPVTKYEDVNYDKYTFKLTRTRRDEKDKDVSKDYKNEITETVNGGSQTFESLEKIRDNDGIYTLTAYITDKAGNKSDESTVTFSVNRFGSVYVYSDYINDTLLEEKYVKKVEQALVITEYNPDKIVADDTHKVSVTCDGAGVTGEVETSPEIDENVNAGDSGWYQYNYTIPAQMFEKDGVYSVSVTSKDEAENISDSSIDNAISFSVDSVKPELTNVSGLEETTYNAQSITVDLCAFDAIGLKSVTVKVNGKEVKKIEDMTDLNECKESFTVGEGINQKITIEVEDLASNKLSTDDSDFKSSYTFEKNITVSTNFFVRWFANKLLFVVSILGGVAVIALVVVLLLRKRRVR